MLVKRRFSRAQDGSLSWTSRQCTCRTCHPAPEDAAWDAGHREVEVVNSVHVSCLASTAAPLKHCQALSKDTKLPKVVPRGPRHYVTTGGDQRGHSCSRRRCLQGPCPSCCSTDRALGCCCVCRGTRLIPGTSSWCIMSPCRVRLLVCEKETMIVSLMRSIPVTD